MDRIFLHHENPRHEPYETQSQVIEYLCNSEEVSQLARDIAQHGLSPLDRFGVTIDHDDGEDSTYIAAEGNRRLCALKLLDDPDLAPPERKRFFEKQAETWTPLAKLPCVIFHDQDDLDLWLKRRHHGMAGGVGQKPWNADQKARHSGSSSRNRTALTFLDYAEQESLISADYRKGRLTTFQRYLSNAVMREALGLDASNPDEIKRNRSDEDFKLLARRFIEDVLDEGKDVNSRQNKESIEKYARELSSLPGQDHKRIEPEPILPEPEINPKPRPKPPKPKRPQKLPWEVEISDALRNLDNWKLQNLYHSICCNVPLKENTPLLAVGVWSFFETLTARMGRDTGKDFHSFLSYDLFERYRLGDRRKVKPLRDVLQRIQSFGNATKHHDTSAAFNGEQLFNDMDSLKDLILKMIEDAASQKE